MTARPRRSCLYMPGANAKALEKAKTLPADVLLLDLEDSVAPEAKDAARDQVAAAVKAGGYGKREVIVRVNALATPWGREDIAAAGGAHPDGILAPKVEGGAEVRRGKDVGGGALCEGTAWAEQEGVGDPRTKFFDVGGDVDDRRRGWVRGIRRARLRIWRGRQQVDAFFGCHQYREVFEERFAGGGVEAAAGLVEDEQARVVDEGAGDQDTLLFALRAEAIGALGKRGDAEVGQRGAGAVVFRGRHLAIGADGGVEAREDNVEGAVVRRELVFER